MCLRIEVTTIELTRNFIAVPIGLLAAGAIMGGIKTLTTITLRKFGLVVYWRGTQRANNGFVAGRFTLMVESCYRFFLLLLLLRNSSKLYCSESCQWKT